MQFKEGATVKTRDGDKVGDIRRVVIDPMTKKVTHLIVEKGFLFKKDRVVPIDLVEASDEGDVWLNADSETADEFVPYEEKYFVEPYRDDANGQIAPDYIYPMYFYPPVGSAFGQGFAAPLPPIGTGTNRPEIYREQLNIPDGALVMEENMGVIDSDGDPVGKVSRLFTDSHNKITHFAVSQGIFSTTEKVVPINWVETLTEGQLRLSVDGKTLQSLRDFEGS